MYENVFDLFKIVNNIFWICSVQWDFKKFRLEQLRVRESSLFIGHPNLPRQFYESSAVNAESKI